MWAIDVSNGLDPEHITIIYFNSGIFQFCINLSKEEAANINIHKYLSFLLLLTGFPTF